MDPDMARFAQVLALLFMFGSGVTILGVAARYAILKTRPKSPEIAPRAPVMDDTRFARLEQAVDAIAIEVERIAEAQRFSAKLMSERLPERLAEHSTARSTD